MMQRTVSRLLIAVLLFASLFINIAFPVNWLAQLSLFEKIVAAGVILALPVFFSGLLFSRSFKETSHPGQALGVNLLGALVGGVAENAVMLGGIPILGVLAILFYVSALIAVPRKTELAIGIAQV